MNKKVVFAFVGLLLAIQLIRPKFNNPPVNSSQDFQNVTQAPAEVVSILKKACYDCHSNETKYPWYAQIAPVSWFLANHINEGREKLNFSTFGTLSAEDRSEALDEAVESIQEGEMPLPSYTWLGLHPEANLSSAERDILLTWFNANGADGGDDAESEDEAEEE